MGRKAKLSDPSYGHGNPRNVDWAQVLCKLGQAENAFFASGGFESHVKLVPASPSFQPIRSYILSVSPSPSYKIPHTQQFYHVTKALHQIP